MKNIGTFKIIVSITTITIMISAFAACNNNQQQTEWTGDTLIETNESGETIKVAAVATDAEGNLLETSIIETTATSSSETTNTISDTTKATTSSASGTASSTTSATTVSDTSGTISTTSTANDQEPTQTTGGTSTPATTTQTQAAETTSSTTTPESTETTPTTTQTQATESTTTTTTTETTTTTTAAPTLEYTIETWVIHVNWYDDAPGNPRAISVSYTYNSATGASTKSDAKADAESQALDYLASQGWDVSTQGYPYSTGVYCSSIEYHFSDGSVEYS